MSRGRIVVGGVIIVALTGLAFWPTPESGVEVGERVDPATAYNPVLAGESLPDGFRQMLPRDAIEPVYDPEFVNAADSGWSDDVQVIGVSEGGEAKAYPVSYLNRREMVIDSIAGIPILVTW